MPELPDVENFRRYLDATALHKRIKSFRLHDARILSGTSGPKLSRALVGRRMKTTRRHGKNLFVMLDGGNWLRFHFGMTGKFSYFKNLDDDPAHDRLRLGLSNGYHFAFLNQRLFGEVGLISDPEDYIDAVGLGPDACSDELDGDAFAKRMGKRRGQLKSALMNQAVIAGIGNVYSDEILFQARLHPKETPKELDADQLAALYRALRRVLQTAIECGAGSDDLIERLPKHFLLRRREKGARCPGCDGTVRTLRISGRTAYYCPSCQAKSSRH